MDVDIGQALQSLTWDKNHMPYNMELREYILLGVEYTDNREQWTKKESNDIHRFQYAKMSIIQINYSF